MKKQFEHTHPLVGLGIILGASFLLAAILGMGTLFRIRAQSDVVSVTGSAKIQVTSDQARWTVQVTRNVRQTTLKAGYDQIANDLKLTRAFLAAQGITDAEMTVNPINMMEVYEQYQSADKPYTLSQTIVVQSADVAKLTRASANVNTIIGQGVIFSTQGLEYYYSKLPEARIALLSQAIDDAKARATELAKTSGSRVGKLKSATSGVVQVQSLNSTDISDYGMYDTSQIEKQITVTVKAAFTLK
jgi:uncharacterized protein